MLNYIKAELWKVLHRRGVYVLLALLLLCTALFFMRYSYGGFSSLAKGISVTMVVGMLAAPLLVQLVDGGTADTLKNELSFGLRRGTVYWGKLCAALLLGLAFCLVLVGGSLAGGWLFLPRGEPEEALEGLALVGFCLAGALPIWCGMFACAICWPWRCAVRPPAVPRRSCTRSSPCRSCPQDEQTSACPVGCPVPRTAP